MSSGIDPLKHNFHEGHRKRMSSRMLEHGSEILENYEIVEMMLFLVLKRQDTRTLAKILLNKFGSINQILNADKEDITSIKGLGEKTFESFQIIKNVVQSVVKEKIEKKKVIECFDDVIAYCKINMQNLKEEELRAIFLTGSGQIIKDKILQKGTIDAVEAYNREIVKKCLEIGAKGIILIHNHPSGDPTPSKADIVSTIKIKEACQVFNINLIDHVVIGGDNYVSLKSLRIL